MHSPHGPLYRTRCCARSPRLHVILYRSVRRERPLNTLSSGVLTRDHEPTCSDHRHVLRLLLHHTPVLLRSFLYVSGLIFLSLSSVSSTVAPPPPPPTSPASSLLPHSLSPLYLLPTQCSSSPGLQRGREKNVCFCFYFLVIVFLHKMNKVNIFYYTEQKRYFSSPD